MDPISRKDAIRRTVLSRRAALGAPTRADLSSAALARLLELPEVDQAEVILASVSVRSELSTGGLIEHVLSSGKRLLAPFVADDGRLAATWVTSVEELTPGFRGIPEPRARMPVAATEADVIVAPGVAFDAACNRMGYGGGFFDAYLATAPRAWRIGLCFECQIVEEVPRLDHDEPMDLVVTEARVIRADPVRPR
jgi:5-formyltetrahydrofolate cyclo-ligase